MGKYPATVVSLQGKAGTEEERERWTEAAHFGLVNPFTAVLASSSLGKTTNRSGKFEIIKGFAPSSHGHMKGRPPKCTALKVGLLQAHQICCLQACICALLSREIYELGQRLRG